MSDDLPLEQVPRRFTSRVTVGPPETSPMPKCPRQRYLMAQLMRRASLALGGWKSCAVRSVAAS
ncbi:MAG: hypothetical protein ACI8QS_003038 [Planctomycetota bacterium]|jgi:hypothetical protein